MEQTDDLIRLVDGWRRRRIVVVGDFMLDHYIYGDAERLSPDAPVPVLQIRREEHVAGGASNVCLDLRALHCDVDAVGVVGKDDAGRQLKALLRKAGCKVTALVNADDRPTTVKHNFVGLAQHRHPQKMFRADHEVTGPLDDTASATLIEHVEHLLDGAAALCIEDYNKGVLCEPVCRRLIALANKKRVPVLVDPAAINDYTKYQHATCITPNRTEAALATTDGRGNGATPQAMASALATALSIDHVIITLDREGALLLSKGEDAHIMPTVARSVYDVTGAGDMVLAMLAAAAANGADWRQAVALANIAAGLEVERFGVVPIELEEVLVALLRRKHEQLGKQRTLDQLVPEVNAYRKQGRKIVFTNGCFDILHAGHVKYLAAARAQGDLLVVGLNSDASIRRIKGPDRPVNDEADRVMVLSALESVDYVVTFAEDDPKKLLRAVKPDVLVKGGDYTDTTQVVGHEIVEKYGGEVLVLGFFEGKSTTNIIRKINRSQ